MLKCIVKRKIKVVIYALYHTMIIFLSIYTTFISIDKSWQYYGCEIYGLYKDSIFFLHNHFRVHLSMKVLIFKQLQYAPYGGPHFLIKNELRSRSANLRKSQQLHIKIR